MTATCSLTVATQTDLDKKELFYAYQTYEFCVHIADAEGMVYDVSHPT